MMSTLQMLEKLYQNKVDFSANELNPYRSFAEQVVITVLAEVQNNLRSTDPKISLEPIGTGSSFEGVKVKPDLEFDFMVPIQIILDEIIFSDKNPDIPVCFGLIQIKRPVSQEAKSKWATDLDFILKFCVQLNRHGHVLSAGKIQQWFQSMCARTLPELKEHFPGINFTFQKNGPARTLVFDYYGKKMNIDIVPAVPYKGVYLVAKMTSHLDLGEAAWRLSFSTHEKAFFDSLRRNSCYFKCLNILKYLRENDKEICPSFQLNFCYFKCLKILKYLRENDKKICPSSQLTSRCPSYYLKTAFFHYVLQIDKYVWQNYNLETQVKGLLLYLAKCMKQQYLPHIFLGNKELVGRRDLWLQDIPLTFFHFKKTNLLKEVNKETLHQISLRLIYIHDNLDKVLQQLCCSPECLQQYSKSSSVRIRDPTDELVRRAEVVCEMEYVSRHHSDPSFEEYDFDSQQHKLRRCKILCVIACVVFISFIYLLMLLRYMSEYRPGKK
ncbi:cyclic GMP-AMP synthase-like [Polypterus senegalus]|nr:cyclic GMP-AMP synthase-like [Polypterus senegalus]XP_039596310.1 cyclic GMP-AMP synthase-like [Polypterus senegalus]